jgi:hydroxymethylpyrimidine kinase/phosphomethylpyrimidine kinase
MPSDQKIPVALTIAGSDSGGGAGIQADLKVFAALGVHGTTAITCITAQNPKRVSAIEPVSGQMVRQQIEAVFEELRPSAVKCGMLFSGEIVQAVADFFSGLKRRKPPLVIDPVLVSTSGSKLTSGSAFETLQKTILPLASLVTPNLAETEALVGTRVTEVEQMRGAARKIRECFGCAVLIKGGHLKGEEAVDIFYDGKTELLLTVPFVRGVRTHGTGCAYSAAITAFLALGYSIADAVAGAKNFITPAIAQSLTASDHFVLNPFWNKFGKQKRGI